ncbi:cation diffusion facilitator CzcD-associated flavoprotein CzcO [Kribbella sp. VKM Ac-2527]|uniref:Cation diffusion facilitator CzcD-associated flavoprotein CzcO n=1 Tax=Kribbella caucasensis TaxID=2512215 RepID=A0A4R6K9J6_9ACTN|nr:NAD(P)-binding domain-containing protein [Kribbella sp. VKM Ac-2527]TDO46389.1 cation diffusion facilitator CzcD-associated flavoprotein CzcO [Kribbella sp. VKM Ac-2527]
MSRYCVIGAGAAGLSSIRQLQLAGHEVVCYEKTDRVGGHWHTDYDALHLITSRDTTAFEDFPMPAHYPHFPRRDQIRDYIESYADAHGLHDVISFGTAVVSVEPVPTDGRPGTNGWRVRTSSGGDELFTGVLVANGHLWDPKVPQVPGEFDGIQLHSSEYRNVGDLEGSRVLVVGAGNSGCDLAVDVAQHRLEADVVMIEGLHFQAKSYFGRPRQQLDFLRQFAPAEQDFVNRMMARLALGDWSDYGMPEPASKTLADGPVTVNSLLLYWIQHGRVKVRPGIERFDGRMVHFADGSSGEYDNILWATGFNARLPFLADDLIPWERGAPVRYAAGILPDAVEQLYFIGLIAPRGPQLPVYGMQAKLVATMIELYEHEDGVQPGLAERFAKLQDPEHRIDIVRDIWLEQLADTERLLEAFTSVTLASAG